MIKIFIKNGCENLAPKSDQWLFEASEPCLVPVIGAQDTGGVNPRPVVIGGAACWIFVLEQEPRWSHAAVAGVDGKWWGDIWISYVYIYIISYISCVHVYLLCILCIYVYLSCIHFYLSSIYVYLSFAWVYHWSYIYHIYIYGLKMVLSHLSN